MHSRAGVWAVTKDRHGTGQSAACPDSASLRVLSAPVRRAISRTRQWLLDRQDPTGYWCGELEGDTILESETILLLAFLGEEDTPFVHRLAAYLIDQQLPDGGWAMYPGGELEISGSVKAYFALKLTGHDPASEPLQRARQAILAHGGADAVNSFTRFYLALLGQIPYERCPAVPPEMLLLPKWFPANLYAVSAWSRTIIVPLSIVSALRPRREVEPRLGIRELFVQEPQNWPPLRCPGLPGGTGWFSWDRFFRCCDGVMSFLQRRRWLPLRRHALRQAERWMLERFERSDGLGAIYPPIVWSWVALRALGYADDSREIAYCRQQLLDLVLEDEAAETARLQPCKSPVWDTSIAVRALAAAGADPDGPELQQAVRWLLDKQVRAPGDWSETVRAEPGGWSFEHRNDFYPDSDDTAMVLMALRTRFAERPAAALLPPELRLHWEDDATTDEIATDDAPAAAVDREALVADTTAAIERGRRWMLAMQNSDGGWGEFDRNNNQQFLCYVPFADHNAMIDPSTPDLTGRVLEALADLGQRVGEPAVDRAVAYMRAAQQADGSWFGRWGVNYIYGTWQSLVGLVAAGVPGDDPAIVAGANWLLAHQQACGGWGESPDSYEQPQLRGQGVPTASQTAWALLGLMAAGLERHPAVIRGIRFLALMQNDDGSWDEPEFTGTGFPRVFYLRYHYYPIYFPLLALSRWAVGVQPAAGEDHLVAFSAVAPAHRLPAGPLPAARAVGQP